MLAYNDWMIYNDCIIEMVKIYTVHVVIHTLMSEGNSAGQESLLVTENDVTISSKTLLYHQTILRL